MGNLDLNNLAGTNVNEESSAVNEAPMPPSASAMEESSVANEAQERTSASAMEESSVANEAQERTSADIQNEIQNNAQTPDADNIEINTTNIDNIQANLENMITIESIINSNMNKIRNCTVVRLGDDVYIAGCMLFKTNDDLFLSKSLNSMYCENFTPTDIHIFNSSISIVSDTDRVFVSTTNVTQYKIVDGVVTQQTKYKKANELSKLKPIIVPASEPRITDVEAALIKVNVICPKVYKAISGTSDLTIEIIKNKVQEFVQNVTDVNFLNKINKEIFMTM